MAHFIKPIQQMLSRKLKRKKGKMNEGTKTTEMVQNFINGHSVPPPTVEVNQYQDKATVFVNGNSMSDIIDELAEKYEQLASSTRVNKEVRARLQELVEKVEEFIKEHVTEGSASKDDLLELAEDLDMELEREATVTFTVEYSVNVTVPLGFDIEQIDEDGFDVDITYTKSHDGVEFDDDETDISRFRVEMED